MEGSIVSAIMEALTDIVSGFLALVINAMTSVVEVFYTPTGGLTIYGIFLLFGLALFFIMFAWRFITGLIRR